MEDIGGQAVIEGVMYRKKSAYSLAVRDSKGKLIIEKGYIKDLRIGLLSFLKLPVFRGMYAMAEMLFYGTKLLMRSASLSDPDEEDLSFWELFLVMLFSIGFAVLIFIVIPYILSSAVMVDEKQSPVLFNIVDAVFKLILFIAYVYAIRQMPDVLRIFRYHGAEHKVINAYESGENIVLANIKKYPTLHKRCSSSFIMLTIAVSIVVFSFAPLIAPYIFPGYQGLVFFLAEIFAFGIEIASCSTCYRYFL